MTPAFKKNNYMVIRKAIDPKIAEFVMNYFMMKRQVARTMFELQSQLETIVILDATEASLDIACICLLLIGVCICRDTTFELVTEGIFGFIFVLLDLN